MLRLEPPPANNEEEGINSCHGWVLIPNGQKHRSRSTDASAADLSSKKKKPRQGQRSANRSKQRTSKDSSLCQHTWHASCITWQLQFMTRCDNPFASTPPPPPRPSEAASEKVEKRSNTSNHEGQNSAVDGWAFWSGRL